MILQGSDNSRFYQVKTDLQNDMTKGTNNFSETVVQTTRLLSNYKVPPRHVRAQEPNSKGVGFVQGAGEKTPVIGTIGCWHSGKKGHYKTSCPELQIDEGVQNLSIKDSVQEHSLFLTDDDYEMLQKEERVFLQVGKWVAAELKRAVWLFSHTTHEHDRSKAARTEGNSWHRFAPPHVHRHVRILRQHPLSSSPEEPEEGRTCPRGSQQHGIGWNGNER